MERIKEKYNGEISTVEIGRPGPGAVKAGGETCMPFYLKRALCRISQ